MGLLRLLRQLRQRGAVRFKFKKKETAPTEVGAERYD